MPKLKFDDYALLDDDFEDNDSMSVFTTDGRHATLLGEGCAWYDPERKEKE